MSNWKEVLAHYLTQDGEFGARAEVEIALEEMADDIADRASERIAKETQRALQRERRPIDAISRHSVG